MSRNFSKVVLSTLGGLALLATSACALRSEPTSRHGSVASAVTSSGPWTVFANPYGDGRPNPAAAVSGSVESTETDTTTTIALSVEGLPPGKTFGAHVHKLACADTLAGGHYQDDPAPAGKASDPAWANPDNEVWLDFTTDADGAGSSDATQDWLIRSGEARSVVIHDHATGAGGVAGPKLACIDVDF